MEPMTYILSAERDGVGPEAMREGFRRYEQFLTANRERFPPSAYALATSDWYYSARDSRSPHDAWLEAVTIEEPATGERHEVRTVAMKVVLLGAYHDGRLQLYYPRVYRYDLSLRSGESGHHDWRYDEFRLTDDGHLIHEIEWYHWGELGRWIIEADDLRLSWHPFETGSDRYRPVVEQLDALVGELDSVLTAPELAEVQHFIDVNEFGLALETACDILHEEHRSIAPAIKARIGHIARLMGMSDPVIDGLTEEGA